MGSYLIVYEQGNNVVALFVYASDPDHALE